MILSGSKPEIKGLFPRTPVLRGHHYQLESRARHASRTSHPLPFLETRPSHPAILYNTPHLTTNLAKHHSLNSALPRSSLMKHIRTGAIHVLSYSANAISSSTCPLRYPIHDPLTVAVLARTPRNMTFPFNAPMPVVAPAAFGIKKTSHATVTPNIPQQRSGTARMRLASIQEGRARYSRGKTILTDMFGPCTQKQTNCDSSSIPNHVNDRSQ